MRHDLAQDFHGDGWLAEFETARTGAFRALTRLHDEGVISGWGLGVNRTEPIELLLGLSEPTPDGSLLAGRYTLLDHEHALQRVMPAVHEQGIDIVIGGPYSSGVLVGGPNFEYKRAPAEIVARVKALQASADRYGIPLKAAALQFCLAHPAVVAVIPGASKPSRVIEDHVALTTAIPEDFWHELRTQHLVSPGAPLPIDNPPTK
jgi:D-threo-aldose 1-dehydrogenase